MGGAITVIISIGSFCTGSSLTMRTQPQTSLATIEKRNCEDSLIASTSSCMGEPLEMTNWPKGENSSEQNCRLFSRAQASKISRILTQSSPSLTRVTNGRPKMKQQTPVTIVKGILCRRRTGTWSAMPVKKFSRRANWKSGGKLNT